MIGKPIYKYKDRVNFLWNNAEKIGEIKIVDAYGTFEQTEEPSYDIEVEEYNCLYKHIRESQIILKCER